LDPEKVWIEGKCRLEAELWKPGGRAGIVLAHPHPLFGGDMWYPLLGVIAQKAGEAGMAALRFNFRGVGMSEGRYSRGEGEVEDLDAAIGYLKAAGCDTVVPVGYSFGAWIVMKWLAQGGPADRWVAVAPPTSFARHPRSGELSGAGLIICGSRDHIAPAARAEREYGSFDVFTLDGADHFFVDFEQEIADIIVDFSKPSEEGRNA